MIAELQKEYLNLDPADTQPVPTPVPTLAPSAPTPTFVPTPAGCVDGMRFISDLSFGDGNGTFFPDVNPNQAVRKGWRIQNTGTCTWNSTYSLRFVSGTQMNGQNTAVQGNVAPGQNFDMWVDLVAPSQPGQYQGNWQMFNTRNLAFGERLRVRVEVIGPTRVPPTQAPATTTPPAPTKVPPTGVPPTAVPPTEVPPTQAPSAPVINSLTAKPTTVSAGEFITISWSFSGQDLASAKLTRINPDGSTTPLNGGSDVSTPGSYDDLAATAGTVTYKLVVSSEFAGSTSQTVTVQVNP